MNTTDTTHGTRQPGRPGPAAFPWRPLAWGAAGALLLTPLVAMQFTDEVNWNLGDFIVFGLMLAVAGGLVELAVRARGSLAYRAGVAVAVGTGFLMTWANLAVGIIGNEENPANLLFFGVILVAAGGAFLSRGEPAGMARAMAAAALAQAGVAITALLLGLGHVFVATAVFMAGWLIAATLFRRST